jgi:hypothetical protein
MQAGATTQKMTVIPDQRLEEASILPSNSSRAAKCGCFAQTVCPCRAWALLEEAASARLRVVPRSSTTMQKDDAAAAKVRRADNFCGLFPHVTVLQGSVTLKPAADQETASCAAGQPCPSATAAPDATADPSGTEAPKMLPALIQRMRCSTCAGHCPGFCGYIAEPSPMNDTSKFKVCVPRSHFRGLTCAHRSRPRSSPAPPLRASAAASADLSALAAAAPWLCCSSVSSTPPPARPT